LQYCQVGRELTILPPQPPECWDYVPFTWLVNLFWRNVYSDPLPNFYSITCFYFWVVQFLYDWDINLLSDTWFVNIFSHLGVHLLI
jgi:hypothetical protein